MASQDQITSVRNRDKINELFSNLQLEITKQKELLLKQVNDGEELIINTQKYETIIDDLKDITTIHNHKPSAQMQSNIESYTMDQLSIWLKNKQLWQFIEKQNIDAIQNNIIKHVFGGFEAMMDYLLYNRTKLSILQHNKLYNVLLDNSSHDIFHNYHPAESMEKITIVSIPDQCLSYIMQFLTQNNRYIAQQTCRLFAVAIRQEGAVNNIENDLKKMHMMPNMKTIIQGIESEDKDKQQRSLQLFADLIDNDSTDKYILRAKIKAYNQETFDKLIELITSNDSELNTKLCLNLHDVSGSKMLDFGIKMLKNSTKIDQKVANMPFEMHYLVNTIASVEFNELIPVLCKLIRESDNLEYTFHDQFYRDNFIWSLHDLISDIAKLGLKTFNKQLVDEGYLDEVKKLAISQDTGLHSLGFQRTLMGMLDNPELLTIAQLYNEYSYLTLMSTTPQNNYSLIMKIFKIGTDKERMQLIKRLLENGEGLLGKEQTDDLLNVLKQVGDIEAHSAFEQYTTANW